jgi:phosphatidylinositol-3-phosphatase
VPQQPSTRARSAVAAACLIVVGLGAGAPQASARASQLHVVARPGGALATFGGHPAGGVVFVLDGVAAARDRAKPYRMFIGQGHAARAAFHVLAVRTLRTGLLLARVRFHLAAGARGVTAVAVATPRAAAASRGPTVELTTVPGSAASATVGVVAWATTRARKALVTCSLDGRRLRGCASPRWLRNLRRAKHVFTVRVRTAAGTARAATSWTTRPAPTGAITVLDRPAGRTPRSSVAFAFTAPGVSHITCQLDGGKTGPCGSPLAYAGLRRGAHRLDLRGATATGTTLTTVLWTIGGPVAGAPTVRIALHPAPGASNRSAVFTWLAARATTVRCVLDGQLARACRSPITYPGVAVGAHRFTVSVANAAGSASASFSWRRSAPVANAEPCGTLPAPPRRWAHVVWIVMENKDYADIMSGTAAPYEQALARRCGDARNFHAERHPSLPNYIALTSGDTQGISDDGGPNTHPLAAPNIFSKVGDWRALQDAMPTPCRKTDIGTYAPRHNPPTYYTDLAATCAARDVALGTTINLSARLTFITPDLNNDTHDTPVAYGDAWLAKFLPRLFATPEYQSGTTAVFLTWDEDDGSAVNRIPTFVFAPSVLPGTAVGTRFDHYAMLRTTEEMLGLPAPYLGRAASSPSMAAAFGLLP